MKRDLSKPLSATFGDPVRKSTNPNKGTSTRAGKNRATTFSSPGGGAPAKKTTTVTRIRKNKQGGNTVSQKVKTKAISNKKFQRVSKRIKKGEARQKKRSERKEGRQD
jgi:hypothetical protein